MGNIYNDMFRNVKHLTTWTNFVVLHDALFATPRTKALFTVKTLQTAPLLQIVFAQNF